MNPAYITRLLHSRAFGVGVGLLAVVCGFLYYFGGYQTQLVGDKGLVLESANGWVSQPLSNFFIGICCSGITVGLMLLLNKIYNVLRSMTSLYIAFFAVMQLATPGLFTQFYTGTVLAIVAPMCMLWLFSCFRDPGATRHIFLIFLLLSFFTATQYCYAFYLPVFLAGLAQMQVFNGRSLTAALLGMLTPWWIMFGFGIITPDEVRLPDFVSIFSVIDHEDTYLLLITIGLTVGMMLACYVLNLLKTIAYNAKARAINGSFMLMALVTVVALCIDYRNIISYVPLLNFLASMEAAHYFSTHRAEKSFVAILLLLSAYIAIFVCQTII